MDTNPIRCRKAWDITTKPLDEHNTQRTACQQKCVVFQNAIEYQEAKIWIKGHSFDKCSFISNNQNESHKIQFRLQMLTSHSSSNLEV